MHKTVGDFHSDDRGFLFFNNGLDLSETKRMYIIENKSPEIIRAWQAHKIESRWFAAVCGSFEIKIVKIDNFESPAENLIPKAYILNSLSLDTLIVEPGHASSIQSLEENSRLLVFSDFLTGSVDDNYKYDSDKWK